MSSSISSFKNELKVLLVVAAVIGAIEGWQRIQFSNRQSEAALVRGFPALADQLASAGGSSMILLGNSLTQTGYDMPLLHDQLKAAGNGDLHVEQVALTGSSPIEWYHNFARNFVRRGKTPDWVVINMSPSGISDTLPAGYRIGWLARETDWGDVPEVLSEDLRDVEAGGQYLQARVSMLYADRWDIRVGLLAAVVPNLWEGMNWVNSGQIVPAPSGKAPPPKTYSLMIRLLDLAKASGAHTLVIAMPAREGYTIDPGLIDILKKYDVPILDCRKVPNLTAAGFKDGWHLNPEGAKIFTVYMAEQLPAATKRLKSRLVQFPAQP